MRLAFSQHWSDLRESPASRRAVSIVLVVAIHLLLLLMLLRLAPPVFAPMKPEGLKTFDVSGSESAPSDSSPAKAERAPQETPRKPVDRKTPPPPPVTPPVSRSTVIWSQVIPLTSDQYAATDIAKAPTPPEPPKDEARQQADATSRGHGDTPRIGTAPNGDALYPGEWVRIPTRAELAFYFPTRTKPGRGVIVCQVLADSRLDNCQETEQTPPGSGLARVLRLASWQFRFRPPTVNGRPIIGAWVQISVTYTESGVRL